MICVLSQEEIILCFMKENTLSYFILEVKQLVFFPYSRDLRLILSTVITRFTEDHVRFCFDTRCAVNIFLYSRTLNRMTKLTNSFLLMHKHGLFEHHILSL
jgi:hypothetical protein